MIQTQTQFSIDSAGNSTSSSILDRPSASVVEIALQALQGAGIRLVEWDTLLRGRMGVPRVLYVSVF
jgi:hypothetical protein